MLCCIFSTFDIFTCTKTYVATWLLSTDLVWHFQTAHYIWPKRHNLSLFLYRISLLNSSVQRTLYTNCILYLSLSLCIRIQLIEIMQSILRHFRIETTKQKMYVDVKYLKLKKKESLLWILSRLLAHRVLVKSHLVQFIHNKPFSYDSCTCTTAFVNVWECVSRYIGIGAFCFVIKLRF